MQLLAKQGHCRLGNALSFSLKINRGGAVQIHDIVVVRHAREAADPLRNLEIDRREEERRKEKQGRDNGDIAASPASF